MLSEVFRRELKARILYFSFLDKKRKLRKDFGIKPVKIMFDIFLKLCNISTIPNVKFKMNRKMFYRDIVLKKRYSKFKIYTC